MVLILGPLYGGKREYACALLGCGREELARYAVWDAQALAADCPDLPSLAEELARHAVVIATETGGGVVPVERRARRAREAEGQLLCLLAARAERVIRVFYGLPVVLKDTEART